jgi:hypothetical protein
MNNNIKNFLNFIKYSNFSIKEIKYLSTDGRKNIPNGHFLEKAGFIKECTDNSNSFITDNHQYILNKDFSIIEGIHGNQYGLFNYRGGIIIFSTDVNSIELNDNILFNWINKKIKTYSNRFFRKSKLRNVIKKFNKDKENEDDYIGAFSIGNFFPGSYIGDNGKFYNENSLSIEINGISSEGLIYFAEDIAKEFNQETVLVKDLNQDKIFLVNQDKGVNSHDIESINKKSK